MKNQDEFSILKKKVLTIDQLLDLRGGAEPGSGGCGPGETLYHCKYKVVEGASFTYGDVCSTSESAAEDALNNMYPNAVNVDCSPAANPY